MIARAADGDLVIADSGQTKARVIVAAKAGTWEKRAADDLVKYIGLMAGAKPTLANTDDLIADALKSDAPLLIVGTEALKADPTLAAALAKVAKKDPVLRADAIALRRTGNRVFLVGLNDDCHYYAVSHLLQRWGCRWYLPTEIGEYVPTVKSLSLGKLEYAYGAPFEVRHYWLAWNASNDGQLEFQTRNFMTHGVGVPSGHAIGQYVQELIPKGKTLYNVPIAEDNTADHIAKKVADLFAKNKPIMLGMEDGIYQSDSKIDKALQANLYDKYFLVSSLTDNFMVMYNKIAERLLKQYPNSTSKIGFLAYSNITLPPQRDIVAAKPLVAYLAPIDIDPIHGMDDPKSPPRHEYKAMLYRWAEVMQGRVVIYDYDQGMLVWRDVPCPCIDAICQDVKHYHKAGILGIDTESRGATATVFLNLFFRAQLYWNPDADVDALLAEFYQKFYGPAAKPMAAFWTAIHNAWTNSIVSEHEHFVFPAIYTPKVIAELKDHLSAAEELVKPLAGQAGRDDKLYVERLKLTRQIFDVLDAYGAMVQAAATECDYKSAVAAGERGLAARLVLAKMSPTYTTRVVGIAAETNKSGPAWWPGEVEQYRDLLQLTDGTKGKLVTRLPLEWAFRRDPHDTGLVSGWAYRSIDLSYWKEVKEPGSIASHQNNPGHWEMMRTDLYPQAQGLISPDFHSYTGFGWYRSEFEITADQANKLHLMFPGLFNECWLYINGRLVQHREQQAMWWNNDYKFEWDVDLTGFAKAGKNTITLRFQNPHHFGGIFRRPFLYQAVK
jgi:hypothetical protein